MARATTDTKLSLDEYADIIGLAPVHFNGAYTSSEWPDSGACEDIWPQYEWQADTDIVSREQLARAIHDAEDAIEKHTGIPILKSWYQHELDYPHNYRRDSVYSNGLNTRYANKAVALPRGNVISAGIKATSLIEAAAAIVYSDPDGDGWSELATITVTTDVDDDEIHIYYPGETTGYEIRPITVASAGGVATITAPAWRFVDPDLQNATPGAFGAIDISSANLVTTVDVYREYNDDSTAITFYWDDYTHTGSFYIRNAKSGIVAPYAGNYSAVSEEWSAVNVYRGEPNRMVINYYAGPSTIDTNVKEAIVALASARLPGPVCTCETVATMVKYYQEDMGARSGRTFNRVFTVDMLECPFGTRMGEYMAWKRLGYQEAIWHGAAI